MNYVLARLAEPSTYASLAAILGGIGYVLPAGVIQNLTLAGMIGAGLGVVAATEQLDVRLIDLYLSMHGKTVADKQKPGG